MTIPGFVVDVGVKLEFSSNAYCDCETNHCVDYWIDHWRYTEIYDLTVQLEQFVRRSQEASFYFMCNYSPCQVWHDSSFDIIKNVSYFDTGTINLKYINPAGCTISLLFNAKGTILCLVIIPTNRNRS